jgi:UDP-glucose:(heptosyl)LPS alpha-1,3-glucosyltransferase
MHKFLIISRTLDITLSAPKCNYNLALALAKLGADVKILTSTITLPKEELEQLLNLGIKIVRVPKIFASRASSPLFYTLIARSIKNDRIIIGNGYTLRDDITWVHFTRLGALKHIPFLSNKERNKLLMEVKIEKIIFKASKKLWAVSNLIKKILTEDYSIPEDKIFVLYNGVDINKYHPLNDEERTKIREKMGLKENTLVMIFVGGDIYRKGLVRILHALKKSAINNYVLYAIGFIPDHKILSLSQGLNVKFLGKISEKELIKYYQISDLNLLLSYFDPFPLVMLEGMASGSIPIVTPTVGVSEIIVNGDNGFIVKNEVELVKLLNNINSLDLNNIRKNAIATARKYSWDNIAKYLMSIVDR